MENTSQLLWIKTYFRYGLKCHWGIIDSTVCLLPEGFKEASILNYIKVTSLNPLVEEVNKLFGHNYLRAALVSDSLCLKFKAGPCAFNSFRISWNRKRKLEFSFRGYSVHAMPYHDWWTDLNDSVRAYRILGLLDQSTWFDQHGFKKSFDLDLWRWTKYPYIVELAKYHSPMRWFLAIWSDPELKKICSFQIYPTMKLGGDLCNHGPFASALQNFECERTFVEFILKHLNNLILPNAGLMPYLQLQNSNNG